MESSELPYWVKYVWDTRQSYIESVNLREEYSDDLKKLIAFLGHENGDLLGPFPIADEEQTSFIINKDDCSAIFFDVGQSAIIKTIFTLMHLPRAQDLLFKTLLSGASLRLSKIDRFYTDKLGDCQTPTFNGETNVNSEMLEKARGSLLKLIGPENHAYFEEITDCTIIFHEIYHYRHFKSKRNTDIEKVVIDNYEYLVELATTDLSLMTLDHLNDKAREKYIAERKDRKEYFSNNRASLIEEITCDIFALINCALYLHKKVNLEDLGFNQFKTFILLHSVSYNIYMLHLAFNESALFYRSHSVDDKLPREMSVYNLRRLAIGVIASEIYAASVQSSKRDGADNEVSEKLQTSLNNVYVEMSHYFLVPLMYRINDCFNLIDREFPLESRGDVEAVEIVKERLWLSMFPTNISPSVLETMLGTSRPF